MTAYLPRIGCTVINLKLSNKDQYKCNSNGAGRGNPGLSLIAICIRDDKENSIYSKERRIKDFLKLGG